MSCIKNIKGFPVPLAFILNLNLSGITPKNVFQYFLIYYDQ